MADVRRHLDLSLGYYEIQEYEKARNEAHRALAFDPHSTAARRLLERIERRAGSLSIGALGTDRQAILDKIQALIIPSVALGAVTVEEAIEFLRLKSKEVDVTTADPARKGVNFLLRLPAAEPTPMITSLNLSNVPLLVAVEAIADMTGLRVQVENYAVILSPAECDLELYTRVFRVPPDFLSLQNSSAGGAKAPAAASSAATATDVLKSAGIPFPGDATASFSSRATSILVVRNTPVNLDLVSKFVARISKKVDRQPPAVGSEASSQLPAGGESSVTGGLRYGDNAISNNPIDGLFSTSANAEGTTESSVTPGVLGLPGSGQRADLVLPQCLSLEFMPRSEGLTSTWSFLPGRTINIPASDDLATWIDLGAASESTSGVYEIIDAKAAGSQSRFYRALVP